MQTFTTVAEYLYLLCEISKMMDFLGSKAMFYLAAAVSDFYIPDDKLSQHKIQSKSSSTLELSLEPVPKILGSLVQEWARRGYVISFKLETDQTLLIPKSRAALESYGHQIVVGNILETRKSIVWMVEKDSISIIELSAVHNEQILEIEELIVTQLVEKHNLWITSNPNSNTQKTNLK